jgi:phosphoglycolate phosphatase-like HAD superfamily hydrolase
MTLLLFDIDGTLVRVNGAGRETIMKALSSLLNHPVTADGISFSGRTDPDILRSILRHNDLPDRDAHVDAALEAYVEAMTGVLTPEDVEVLPGVHSLLDHLADHPDVHLGLVTGNVEPIAYEKLGAHGLDDYFPVGAFGSDHADRNKLPHIATRRAASHTGHDFHPAEQAVVIGDTPHDIECARAAGARVVGVCTGHYNHAELSPHDPDWLLDTLPAPESFLERLLD